VRGSRASQSQSTCVQLRSLVRSSSTWRCGSWRWRDANACARSEHASPRESERLVIVACREPKTRSEAEGSSPRAQRRQHDGDPAREAGFRRYRGVWSRALNVV